MSENPSTTIFKPFLDRVSHPILSWVILFNIIFNYEKIIKLTLVIAGKATTRQNVSDQLVSYIPLNELIQFSYCSFFSAILIGSIIGIVWPILDKVYQEHISRQTVSLENAIAQHKNQSILGQINGLQISLEAMQHEVNSIQNFFCSPEGLLALQSLQPFNDPNSLRIQIHKCEENIDVGKFVALNTEGKAILTSENDKVLGIVVAKITKNLCIILSKGITKAPNILIQFLEKNTID